MGLVQYYTEDLGVLIPGPDSTPLFAFCYAVPTSLFPPQSPPRLCNFSQWIDDKIHPYDMWMLLTRKSWVREDIEARERRLEELQAEKDEKDRRDRLREEQEREHTKRC